MRPRIVAAEGVFPKSLRYRGLHVTQRRSGERLWGSQAGSLAPTQPTEGAPGDEADSARLATPNLSGKEDRRGEVEVSLPPICCSLPETFSAEADPAQCHPPRRGRAHGRLRRLGHAGQLRLADRRAPCGAPRRRACSTSRTCARSTSTAPARATSCACALANNVDKLKEPGKALYSCLLAPDGGVLDDLIVYFLREDFFRIVVNAGTTDKDIAWFRAPDRRTRAATVAHAARATSR